MEIIKKSGIWFTFSLILVGIALFGIIGKGLNYGIDFTGGNLFELKFEKEINIEKINEVLDKIAEKQEQFSSTSRKVQLSEGNIVVIRTSELTASEKELANNQMKELLPKYEVLKVEKVGSIIGKELKNKALYALIIGSILIVFYITIRFELKFAIAAIIALIHDVVISVGGIALLGYEINTPFIAATLTILGYSINDTIVVFDRIRENMKKGEKVKFSELINKSLNQVMVRSINTSLTTLLAILAILLFGGESLRTFITTLLIGMLAGTYSSIFLASPLVNIMQKKEENKKSLETETVEKA